ncbi:MAG: bifunctional metallophosphatase/5'-nucleotidase [Myxococcota bacterium]
MQLKRELTLLSFMMLALAACSGDDGQDGRDGESCTVAANNSGGATITCPDGTSVDVPGGMAGMDGTNCSVTDNQDGTITIDCGETQVTYSAAPEPDTDFTLQILHMADGEARADAVLDAPRFSAVLDALRNEFPNTVTLSSGDNFIAGPWASVSDNSELAATIGIPAQYRPDIIMMNAMGFQASCIGNHEFDSGPAGFASAIIPESTMTANFAGANFPYLSSNVDVRADADLGGLVTTDGQEAASIPGRIAKSTVITVNGERIGVVGATTPTLGNIANIGTDIVVTPTAAQDRAALAGVIQAAVDNLTATGIDKVIVLAHMQSIQVELDLAPLLRDVDVIIAGGSNTILADSNDRLREGDMAADTYPVMLMSAAAEPVLVVNTDGSWRYVGRFVVPFSRDGLILTDRLNDAINGAYATDDAGVAAVSGVVNPTVQAIANAIGGVLQTREGNIFGRTNVYLNGLRASVRSEETNLGNLTAEANLWQARQVEPMVAFSIKNGGGIRDEIGFREFPPGSTDPEDEQRFPPAPIPSANKQLGDISEGDISRTLAFNNGLVTFDSTAANLKALMEAGIGNWDGAQNGNMPQVAGIKFSFDPSLPTGSRVRTLVVVDENDSVVDIVVQNGEIVGDETRIFRGVTLDFLFNIGGEAGRDGYPFPRNPEANTAELEDVITADGDASFAVPGSEQDALAEYLLVVYPSTMPFMAADTPIEEDTRIQNLSVRADTVLP